MFTADRWQGRVGKGVNLWMFSAVHKLGILGIGIPGINFFSPFSQSGARTLFCKKRGAQTSDRILPGEKSIDACFQFLNGWKQNNFPVMTLRFRARLKIKCMNGKIVFSPSCLYYKLTSYLSTCQFRIVHSKSTADAFSPGRAFDWYWHLSHPYI